MMTDNLPADCPSHLGLTNGLLSRLFSILKEEENGESSVLPRLSDEFIESSRFSVILSLLFFYLIVSLVLLLLLLRLLSPACRCQFG